MLFNIPTNLPTNLIREHTYVAKVVDNNDPLMLCRVRIRIPDIHGTIPDEHCPWAIQERETSMGADEEIGSFGVPRIGSKVSVYHHRGDPYSPIYKAEIYDGSTEIEEALEGYPNSHGFKDSDGNLVRVNMDSDEGEIVFHGDVRVDIREGDQDGDLRIQLEGGEYVHAKDVVVIQADGDAILQSNKQNTIVQASKGGVVIKAPTIRLDGNVMVGTIKDEKGNRLYTLEEVKDLLNEIKERHNRHITQHSGTLLPTATGTIEATTHKITSDDIGEN